MPHRRRVKPACDLKIGELFTYVGAFTSYYVGAEVEQDSAFPGRVLVHAAKPDRLRPITIRLPADLPCTLKGRAGRRYLEECVRAAGRRAKEEHEA